MQSPHPKRLGRHIRTSIDGESVRAFVPPPLPREPPIDILRLIGRLGRAERALGRLDSVGLFLPDTELFLYMYVRKEAVLSSQIEGTQSSLSDLLLFEADAASSAPVDDIREISNYVDATMYGVERLEKLPLSLRLIRELHQRILDSGRGARSNPGEFRRSQNWIGGSRPGNAVFVPPPASELPSILDSFERFMHDDETPLPPLIKAGLVHVQFETIHPFLDGNGRVGRLLVTLYLYARKVIGQPLLYLSLYLKTHRADYYRLLQDVREKGAWEEWLDFFLDGVADTANQAADAAVKIRDLIKRDRDSISAQSGRKNSVLRLHDCFQQRAYATAGDLVARTGLSPPTVNAALDNLQELGVIAEVTGKKRGRIFCYVEYVAILNVDADPLPRDAG